MFQLRRAAIEGEGASRGYKSRCAWCAMVGRGRPGFETPGAYQQHGPKATDVLSGLNVSFAQ